MNDVIIKGPYELEYYYCIEHVTTPHFIINWSKYKKDVLKIEFFGFLGEEMYKIMVDKNISLYDCKKRKDVIKYDSNPDWSLGKRLI